MAFFILTRFVLKILKCARHKVCTSSLASQLTTVSLDQSLYTWLMILDLATTIINATGSAKSPLHVSVTYF